MIRILICCVSIMTMLGLPGCGENSSSQTPSTQQASQVESTGSASSSVADFVAEAKQAIDESNVSDELERLEAEIAADVVE